MSGEGVSATQEIGTLGDLHPVFQPSGAVGPSLRMNTMNVSPAVTSMAPTQSTRLYRSVSEVTLGPVHEGRLLIWKLVGHVAVDGDHRADAAQEAQPRQKPEVERQL